MDNCELLSDVDISSMEDSPIPSAQRCSSEYLYEDMDVVSSITVHYYNVTHRNERCNRGISMPLMCDVCSKCKNVEETPYLGVSFVTCTYISILIIHRLCYKMIAVQTLNLLRSMLSQRQW